MSYTFFTGNSRPTFFKLIVGSHCCSDKNNVIHHGQVPPFIPKFFFFICSVLNNKPSPKFAIYRNYKNIDASTFTTDIKQCLSIDITNTNDN